MGVDRLDHLVLTVADIDATCAFYEEALGMVPVTFGDGRRAVTFGRQKINLHEVGREFEPKATHPAAGSADLCFITEIPLSQVSDHFAGLGVEVIEGPVARAGAIGRLKSLYVRDPDGNLVEVSNYLDEEPV